jgi:hypothetical protein
LGDEIPSRDRFQRHNCRLVRHDKVGVLFLDRPWRREAATGHRSATPVLFRFLRRFTAGAAALLGGYDAGALPDGARAQAKRRAVVAARANRRDRADGAALTSASPVLPGVLGEAILGKKGPSLAGFLKVAGY